MTLSRKQEAIRLRQEGYTYTDISKKTGLAKSTLSYHLATVPFEPNDLTKKRLKLAQARSAITKNRQKIAAVDAAKKAAYTLIKNVSLRDKFIAGIALYAGEGSKTHNLVRLVNTNPKIARFFVDWLELLDVPRSHVYVRIHGYPDTDFLEAEKFWRRELRLAADQMQRQCIDKRTNKDNKRAGNHPYGTVHITVKALGDKKFGAALARKIEALGDILLS